MLSKLKIIITSFVVLFTMKMGLASTMDNITVTNHRGDSFEVRASLQHGIHDPYYWLIKRNIDHKEVIPRRIPHPYNLFITMIDIFSNDIDTYCYFRKNSEGIWYLHYKHGKAECTISDRRNAIYVTFLE